MPFTYFTDDQKLRASEVDLERFLLSQGEELIRSGPEKRLKRDHSVTIRGNGWYDHAIKEGGGPVSFVQRFYNLSYPEAMSIIATEIPHKAGLLTDLLGLAVDVERLGAGHFPQFHSFHLFSEEKRRSAHC